MTIDTLRQELAPICGEAFVREAPQDRAVNGRVPLLAVAPGDAEQAAAVLALLSRAGVNLVPWGGGTQQSWGAPLADGPFVVLETRRLNRVLDYTPDDLTISVEAGMTIAALNAVLAANGQMLPLDLPLPAETTVGGAIATALDGPRRSGYGWSRDLLIGIAVIDADGRRSKAGGMVVKNVSGFDMMKLYGGSFGTLALIVSANFKLLPLPRAAATLLCRGDHPSSVQALAAELIAGQLTPMAVEYLEQVPSLGAAAALAVRCEGLPPAVDRQRREIAAAAAPHGLAVEQLEGAAHEALWAQINDLPQTAHIAADELVLRLMTLPAELPAALDAARRAAAAEQLSLQVTARTAAGVAYLRLNGPLPALTRWFAGQPQRPGAYQLLAAPDAAVREAAPAFGPQIANAELMRRIKHEFDPRERLNPGRLAV
jgi:glycolate oxidase FAD binding subunit